MFYTKFVEEITKHTFCVQ